MSNLYENEIPKYLKSKESNISKSKKKSKHKHQYKECLIQYDSSIRKGHIITTLHSYYTICDKIEDRFRFKEDKSIVRDYRRTVDTSIGKYYSIIPSEELYEKYHDKLPVFFVEDIKDGYVNLNGEQK